MTKFGQSVNPNNTAAISFTRRRKLKRLIFWGSGITVRTEVKYLGVVLDQRLNCSTQLNRVIDRRKWSLMTRRPLVVVEIETVARPAML